MLQKWNDRQLYLCLFVLCFTIGLIAETRGWMISTVGMFSFSLANLLKLMSRD